MIGVGPQVENNIRFFQNRQPALGGIIRDTDILGNVMDVQHLPGTAGWACAELLHVRPAILAQVL